MKNLKITWLVGPRFALLFFLGRIEDSEPEVVQYDPFRKVVVVLCA